MSYVISDLWRKTSIKHANYVLAILSIHCIRPEILIRLKWSYCFTRQWMRGYHTKDIWFLTINWYWHVLLWNKHIHVACINKFTECIGVRLNIPEIADEHHIQGGLHENTYRAGYMRTHTGRVTWEHIQGGLHENTYRAGYMRTHTGQVTWEHIQGGLHENTYRAGYMRTHTGRVTWEHYIYQLSIYQLGKHSNDPYWSCSSSSMIWSKTLYWVRDLI